MCDDEWACPAAAFWPADRAHSTHLLAGRTAACGQQFRGGVHCAVELSTIRLMLLFLARSDIPEKIFLGSERDVLPRHFHMDRVLRTIKIFLSAQIKPLYIAVTTHFPRNNGFSC
jgi:hypothetical protein